ncbi:MAG: xanthine dehydrogenase family protein molybdopterin-binding subunit [Chloroflexi bacterium]|nr:xanthine dehydrogenase family protein molybdopterin-binding subunit [Chloroflexota bacterium]
MKSTATNSPSTLGQAVPRVEGLEKVAGLACYTADVSPPGLLWGAVLRSPLPHARIARVDASRARALPGVHAVLTGQDLAGIRYGRRLNDIPVLAFDRVLFIGDKVAAVAAESRELAEAALAMIEVEYEELPAVFDPLEAMQPGAPLLHPELRTYRGWAGQAPEIPNLLSLETVARGDLERGFAESELVFEHTITFPMIHQGYIEPNVCTVAAEADGTFRIWASNKSQFLLRNDLAAAFGLAPEQIVVEPTLVGGDFGGKGALLDAPVCFALARAAGRPVKLVMDYTEELTAANPRHPAVAIMRTGLTRDGRLVAHHAKLVFNSGAYGGHKPLPSVGLAASHHAAGVYRIPHARVDSYMVYTNQVPGGHMRAPGEVQATVALEVHMDLLAEQLGLDPLEFRLLNAVEEGDEGPLGERWQGIQLKRCIQLAREAAGWDRLQTAETPRRREAFYPDDSASRRLGGEASKGAPGLRVGRGIAVCQRGSAGGQANAEVRVYADGSVVVLTGTSESGTGALTVLAQVVAAELQLPLEQVRVEMGGTDVAPFDQGSGGSRTTVNGGNAALQAAREVRRQMAELAAEYLGCAPEAVEVQPGRFCDRGRPEVGLGFQVLAARVAAEGPLVGRGSFSTRMPSQTGFAAQIAEVEVDPETGQLEVTRVVGVHDVGQIINYHGATGQIDGGIVLGFGCGVLEELRLENGRVGNPHLGDYRIPCSADVPTFESILVTDAPGAGPFGAKGVAELSLLPTAAAIVNAVHDATGVWILDLPITAEKLRRALARHGST